MEGQMRADKAEMALLMVVDSCKRCKPVLGPNPTRSSAFDSVN